MTGIASSSTGGGSATVTGAAGCGFLWWERLGFAGAAGAGFGAGLEAGFGSGLAAGFGSGFTADFGSGFTAGFFSGFFVSLFFVDAMAQQCFRENRFGDVAGTGRAAPERRRGRQSEAPSGRESAGVQPRFRNQAVLPFPTVGSTVSMCPSKKTARAQRSFFDFAPGWTA